LCVSRNIDWTFIRNETIPCCGGRSGSPCLVSNPRKICRNMLPPVWNVCRTFYLTPICLVRSIDKNCFILSYEKFGSQSPFQSFGYKAGWATEPTLASGLQVFTRATKMTHGDDETSVQRKVGDIQVGAKIILKLVSNIVGLSARFMWIKYGLREGSSEYCNKYSVFKKDLEILDLLSRHRYSRTYGLIALHISAIGCTTTPQMYWLHTNRTSQTQNVPFAAETSP
jgi:hypothetical protein